MLQREPKRAMRQRAIVEKLAASSSKKMLMKVMVPRSRRP